MPAGTLSSASAFVEKKATRISVYKFGGRFVLSYLFASNPGKIFSKAEKGYTCKTSGASRWSPREVWKSLEVWESLEKSGKVQRSRNCLFETFPDF
jgi:hypothetical protein